MKLFDTQIQERDAYRAIFSFGGALSELDPSQVSNLKPAITNALAFAGEVVSILKQASAPKAEVA